MKLLILSVAVACQLSPLAFYSSMPRGQITARETSLRVLFSPRPQSSFRSDRNECAARSIELSPSTNRER